MKIYRFNNLIINLEEVNYINKEQSKFYHDRYYLIFSMKNGSEFCSAEESEKEINFKMNYIIRLMEGN
jgi:hypothetical protein